MGQILIVVGEDYTVAGAIGDLRDRLNQLLSEYEFINSMVVTIDRQITDVSTNTRVYAIQMLKGK